MGAVLKSKKKVYDSLFPLEREILSRMVRWSRCSTPETAPCREDHTLTTSSMYCPSKVFAPRLSPNSYHREGAAVLPGMTGASHTKEELPKESSLKSCSCPASASTPSPKTYRSPSECPAQHSPFEFPMRGIPVLRAHPGESSLPPSCVLAPCKN